MSIEEWRITMKRNSILLFCAIMIAVILVGCEPAQQPTETQDNREWIEIEKNCYIIDDHTRQIIDQTTFELKGWVEKVDGPTFIDGSSDGVNVDGYMNIAAYPIPREEFPGSTPTAHISDKYVLYVWHPIRFNLDSATDTEHSPFFHIKYEAYFALENPEWNWINIFTEEETFMAVCADSEEEAWDNYMNFMKVYMDLD